MNRKVSILSAGGIGILMLVIGFVARSVAPGFNAPARPAITRSVQITLRDPVAGVFTCDFKADNGDKQYDAYKFPVLRPRHGGISGDSVTWSIIDGRTVPAGLSGWEVDFPKNNTPFTDEKGAAKWQFTDTDPSSGDSSKSRSDFPYEQVWAITKDLGRVQCSNAKDPGVHVDQ